MLHTRNLMGRSMLDSQQIVQSAKVRRIPLVVGVSAALIAFGCNGATSGKAQPDSAIEDSSTAWSRDQGGTAADTSIENWDSQFTFDQAVVFDTSSSSDSRQKSDLPGTSDAVNIWDAASPSDAPSWSSACLAFAKASCEIKSRCGAYGFHLSYGTIENCEARYGGSNCENQMRSPGSTVAPYDLLACATALSAETCGEDLLNVPTECLLKGGLADGVPCTYDEQCQSGLCNLANGTWCGSCKPKARLGEDCSPFLRSCGNGLACANPSGDTFSWVCVTPVAAGVACQGDPECSWGLVCINRQCTPTKSLGQACVGRDCDDTQDLICLAKAGGGGSVCSQVSYVAPGEACNENTASECVDNAICKGATGLRAAVGVCSAAAGDGSPCDSSVHCQYAALCLGGKCKTPAEIVGSCQ